MIDDKTTQTSKNNSEKYQEHPIAAIFPMIEGEAFEQFKADIKEHGIKELGLLYEGKILDGRNRYKAACELGIEMSWMEVELGEPDEPTAAPEPTARPAIRMPVSRAQQADEKVKHGRSEAFALSVADANRPPTLRIVEMIFLSREPHHGFISIGWHPDRRFRISIGDDRSPLSTRK